MTGAGAGLERLTEPLDEAPADKAGGEMMEGLEDVGALFAADSDPAVAGEPGQAVAARRVDASQLPRHEVARDYRGRGVPFAKGTAAMSGLLSSVKPPTWGTGFH
jgi:hypothetical protein